MLTITAIKADVGSIGGHTEPSVEMLEVAREGLAKSKKKGLITGSPPTSAVQVPSISRYGRCSPVPCIARV